MNDKTKQALYWVQDYLARRPHSEKELTEKLLKKEFSNEITIQAIEFAISNNWLENPQEVSERVYQEWNQKNKSHNWIVGYLSKKGLPNDIYKDEEEEAKKALYHLKKKFKDVSIDKSNYNSAASSLASKGFSFCEFSAALEKMKMKMKMNEEELNEKC